MITLKDLRHEEDRYIGVDAIRKLMQKHKRDVIAKKTWTKLRQSSFNKMWKLGFTVPEMAEILCLPVELLRPRVENRRRLDEHNRLGRERAKQDRARRKSPAGRVYFGSNGVATRKYLKELEKLGLEGKIGAGLFRAQKASSRAKKYRGSFPCRNGATMSYKKVTYDRKSTALEKLCHLLAASDLVYGWGKDPNCSAEWVLYVELPQGQVSFHSYERFEGPDHIRDWDKQKGASEDRVIDFCNSLTAREGE